MKYSNWDSDSLLLWAAKLDTLGWSRQIEDESKSLWTEMERRRRVTVNFDYPDNRLRFIGWRNHWRNNEWQQI